MYVYENLDGETVEFEALDAANDAAKADSHDNAREVTVRYRTSDGHELVVTTFTPVPPEQYFKPWERIENPKFQAPHFPGYVPAYTRKRITATVYRANDKSHWLIHDGRTGGTVTVKNTKLACRKTSDMKANPIPAPAEAVAA